MKFPDAFLQRIDKAGPGGCWEWLGTTNAGYPRYSITPGRQVYAHRYSYEIACGPIPAGHMLLHACFNTACVNPAHLFLETNVRGERVGRSKLSEEAVRYIRRERKRGITAKVLAKQFGLSLEGVYYAAGTGWKHVR